MIFRTLICAVFFSLVVSRADATTLFSVVDPSGVPAGNRDGNLFGGPFTIGQEFTVGSFDILVTSLGYEDAGADGLETDHRVGLWDSGGGLVVEAVVPEGTGTNKIEAWRFVELTNPVVLSAGETYRIGGETTVTDQFFTDTDFGDAGPEVDFAISGDAALVASSNRFRLGFGDPTSDGLATPLRWAAANIEYSVVPEPSTFLLYGLAGLAGVMRRRG